MNLTVVYGASKPSERAKLWECIKLLSIDTTKPWLILGDFIEIRRKEERIAAKARVCPANLEAFNNCIDESSLNELHSIGEEISWYNMRSGEEMIAKN